MDVPISTLRAELADWVERAREEVVVTDKLSDAITVHAYRPRPRRSRMSSPPSPRTLPEDTLGQTNV